MVKFAELVTWKTERICSGSRTHVGYEKRKLALIIVQVHVHVPLALNAYLNLLYTTAMIKITSTVIIATVIIRFVAIL